MVNPSSSPPAVDLSGPEAGVDARGADSGVAAPEAVLAASRSRQPPPPPERWKAGGPLDVGGAGLPCGLED